MFWRKGTFVALAVLAGWSSGARAEFISGSGGLNGLGAFTGTFTYTPDATDPTKATLAIGLTNTSPGGTGYLTAFVFNNPGGKVTGASLLASDSDFGLLGASPFSDGVGGSPFGQFDLGASTGGGFEGGGSPSKGIGVGQSATFTFTLAGTALNSLTASSFFSSLSVPPGQGEGPEAFVVRFRGFQPRGSDKVPGVLEDPIDPVGEITQTPEPSALLTAAGLAMLTSAWAALRRWKRGA